MDTGGRTEVFRAASRALEGQDRRLVVFAFDLLFEGTNDLRRAPLRERKARLKALLRTMAMTSVSATWSTSRAAAPTSCIRPAN